VKEMKKERKKKKRQAFLQYKFHRNIYTCNTQCSRT